MYFKTRQTVGPYLPQHFVQQCFRLRWSPGFAVSSIILMPQPRPMSQWRSQLVALSPHAQQNSYLQNAHVMWLQPRFFSMRVRHIGQNDTLPAFCSAQPSSYRLIASSQVTYSPCQTSRHLKHTSVAHFEHSSFTSSQFFARICVSQPGFGQNLIRGSPSSVFAFLNLSYLLKSSSGSEAFSIA